MSADAPPAAGPPPTRTGRDGAPLARTLALARPAAARLGGATLLGAGAAAAAIGLLATSAWLISRASERPRESALALAIVAVQFFALSRGLLRYAERLQGHDAAFRVLASVRTDIYRRLTALAPAGLPVFRGGDLLARLVHDVDAMQDILLRVLPPFTIAALTGAATVTLAWWILESAGLILLTALLLGATFTPWLTGRLARRRESRQAGARAELTSAVVDLVEGAPELLVNGTLEDQLRRASRADRELTRISLAGARTAGAGQGLATLLCGLAMWGSLLVGVSALRSGELEATLLAVIALVPLAAFELVGPLPAATQTLARVRASAARVFDVCDAEPLVLEPRAPGPVPDPPYALRARGLRVRYSPRGPWVLDGVDLDLSPGRRVAVLGSSGAGKTTLAQALLRFVPYESGSVTLSGVEIARLDADAYRGVVGTVAQDDHVFDATLAKNLLLARPGAGEGQLRAALERVQLLAWVDSLPEGLATELGPYGERISGGERRRLALCRALLADFPVLILDEPTEHLDAAMGDAILAEVLSHPAPAAVLVITHRLTRPEDFDEIIVLEQGSVRERGRHAELVSGGGRYCELWGGEPEPSTRRRNTW